MNTSLLNMKIPELRSALSFADNYGIGDDFLFADIHYSSELRSLLYPMRLDGYMVVFVLSARLGMDINLNHYEIENGSMFFCTPGNLLHLTSNMTTDEERSDLHIVLVALSREFITNIHYDFNKLFAESLAILHHPYIDLTDNEVSIFRRYLKMMAEILGMQVEHKKEIMGSPAKFRV